MFLIDDIVSAAVDIVSDVVDAAGDAVEHLTFGLLNPVDLVGDIMSSPLGDFVGLAAGFGTGGLGFLATPLLDDLLEVLEG